MEINNLVDIMEYMKRKQCSEGRKGSCEHPACYEARQAICVLKQHIADYELEPQDDLDNCRI